MNKPPVEPPQYSSPARSAQASFNAGHHRFEGLLFPVYTPEEVNEKKRRAETMFAGADAMPLAYAFPPAENPMARYRDNGEVAGIASKIFIHELDKYRILNVLIIAARFGGSTPLDRVLHSAYENIVRKLLEQCGKAPLSKRSS